MVSCVAVVTARGGSKGIPQKNLRILAGKPLIAWTLEAAQAAHSLDRVVVSTDSEDIAEVARHHGGDVPFLRPEEFAQDDTPGIDPLIHAVVWLEEHEGLTPEFVMLLQPTSPLRRAEDIDRALEMAIEKKADSVVSVSPADTHPFWMKRLDAEGRMENFIKQEQPVNRRQDLPAAYALNGAIYLVRREVLLERKTFFTENTFALVMPRERSLDVDTFWDLYLADLILEDRKADEALSCCWIR